MPIRGVPPLEMGSRPAGEKPGEVTIGVLNSEDWYEVTRIGGSGGVEC